MNTFKKKSLYAAVLVGLGALGAAGTANAVHINPDGLGQFLIYPYYTARASVGGSYNTLMSVVNTTNQTKAVKVRFLEGRNSQEVLDFNLYMSPSDVFTAVVVQTPLGAKLISNDNSCVTPSDLFTEGTNGGRPGLNDFKNVRYSNTNKDAGPQDLDRTREGYFEIIEMGVVTDAAVIGYSLHAGGVPANCPAIDALDATMQTRLIAPNGGLMGRATVLNAQSGGNYAYDATAVDAYSNRVIYTSSGQDTPRTGDTFPPISNVFVGTNGTPSGQTGVVTAAWLLGRDAFSATIMRNTVLNEYVLDAGTASQTDWVVTYPTKREYVSNGAGAAVAPFASNFSGTSCDLYGASPFNREEGKPGQTVDRPLPSPLAPTTIVGNGTCYEANVIPFQAASLLGSVNTSFPTPDLAAFLSGATTKPSTLTTPGLAATQGPNGWLQMAFNQPIQFLQPVSATFNGAAITGTGRHLGLPVISLAFSNFNKTGVISQYGQVSQAKYTRFINTQ